MAATDQHYRNQKTLDIVFAVSCIAMLLSTIWMFWDDYNKQWKKEQRIFRDVEEAINERIMLERLPDAKEVEKKRDAVKAARDGLEKGRKSVADEASKLQARRDIQDAKYLTIKAEYDAKASYYVITSDELTRALAGSADEGQLKSRKEAEKKELDKLGEDLAKAKSDLDKIDAEIRDLRNKKLDGGKSLAELEKDLGDAEDDQKRLTGEFDRFAKATALKRWKFGDWFRQLPIIDSFESPVKIRQIWLPDLTIDYSFKEVPRYDRCTTCHLGIDRAMFERSDLAKLGSEPEGLKKRLDTARDIFKEREKAGENLGFDLSDLPDTVRTVKLTKGRVTEFAAHPRLDLFVDTNSPHAMEKFGCTICHSGQGSATDFTLAAHSPANPKQHHEWHHDYGWVSSHYWDYPMLSSRFVESSCLKCHHQVTDLIRYGSKNEAPKVTRGFELIRENGCFGCHEISGFRSGRGIGPDLRLESTPPLVWQTSAEQEKAKNDTLNPPGTYRKVGPSLRRIVEKTNEKWTRQWLNSPRGFREDTKMPHFYNLSTNSPDVLPDTQKKFPAAEMHAITHYLFFESKGQLEAKDTNRIILHVRRDELLTALVSTKLDEKAKKDLDEVLRSMTDLYLMSVPTRAAEINDLAASLRRKVERMQELRASPVVQKLLNNQEDESEEKKQIEAELERLPKEVQDLVPKFDAAGTPTPIKDRLLNSEGQAVTNVQKLFVDATAASKVRGRKLFVEKGCLACHSHKGTEQEQAKSGDIPKQPAISSEANFGPNLSRIAAKIKIIKQDGTEDAPAGRRWLTQWILDPNLHHPRTRMPVTRLADEDARDIADWLLSQDASYDGKEPEEPDHKTLINLARVYFAKAPGMTRKDVDTFLPETGEVGLPDERLNGLARDAEERRLKKGASDKDLLWYIGKKSISRMGCYGCHDVAGFEQAKPIGTALNDWGKKDPERLAFEDAPSYVRQAYHIVPDRLTKKELQERIEKYDRAARLKKLEELKTATDNPALEDSYTNEIEAIKKLPKLTPEEEAELKALKERLANAEKEPLWSYKDGKPPYEEQFFDALDHAHKSREGFLHLKLEEPRSYDFNRDRAWDDRLRMPQFQFARSRQHTGESDEDYKIRQTREEAEAREAVMTFVLGLTAENIPSKYIPKPNPDRAAEVKGRQVIEKFNCAACHQFRSGTFEFKPTAPIFKISEDEQLRGPSALDRTYVDTFSASRWGLLEKFPGHNAYTGQPSPFSDRAMAYGTLPVSFTPIPLDRYDALGARVDVRLAEALRFDNQNRLTRDLPSGQPITLERGEIVHWTPPFGGTFPSLILPHLKAMDSATVKQPDAGLNLGPPPLNREGERVQPNWLYQFLLNPRTIRPHVVLNMPRFNMSPDDARALADYFVGVERQTNPGAGVEPSYVAIHQQERSFWEQHNAKYVGHFPGDALAKRAARYDDALKQAFPVELEVRLNAAERTLQDAEKAAKEAKDDAKKEAEKKKKEAEDAVKAIKDALKATQDGKVDEDKLFKEFRKTESERDVYASDSYRLLVSTGLATCISCHTINGAGAKLAPSLDMANERLRPEWVKKWVANPAAMFSYSPVMPAIFKQDVPKPSNADAAKKWEEDRKKWTDLLDGDALDRIIGVRNAIFDLPRIANMPTNRFYRDTAPPPPP